MNISQTQSLKKKEGSRKSSASPARRATPVVQLTDSDKDTGKEATPGTSRGSESRKEATAVISLPPCLISDTEGETDSSACTAVSRKKRPRSSGDSDQRRATTKGRRVESPDQDSSSAARRIRRMPTEDELADDLRRAAHSQLGRQDFGPDGCGKESGTEERQPEGDLHKGPEGGCPHRACGHYGDG